MPKKKANWERVVSNSSDSCVVKTDAATLTTDEEKSDEPTLWVVEGEPSEVMAQVGGTLVEIPKIASPPPPEEEVRSEAEKKVVEEESRELVVSFLDFMQYSVTSLLKYIDKKREKYDVEKEPDCKAARSLEVECKVRFKSDCGQLQEQLKLVAVQLEESRVRVEKVEQAYQQLQDETTDGLHLRVEKCLRGFVTWKVQTMKWLKLNSLERRLMSMKANGSAGHKQLVQLVNSFSSGLKEVQGSLEIEIVSVLRS
ncbi:hypothetical protein AXG93_1669s1080 [Marchantia polymorpha subsp. ruderalis]|uniref:Uncharacterized protein n=1 Tax=Marchantia polymorpha subsp. ruderalis TaxID=1480154 RepID=A0A176W418_MARPO|nr:hypothetical protein AXG93_1669s1080 [Marchantia polymorpha subsp. ruderalis]